MKADRITLAVLPPELPECRGLGLRLCHLGYRISSAGELLKSRALGEPAGGRMAVMGGIPASIDAARLAEQIAAECAARNYGAVVLDAALSPGAASLRDVLLPRLAAMDVRLFLDPALGAPSASLLFSGGVTGGSFALYVRELFEKYRDRAALEIVPLSLDFTLPSSGDDGAALPPERLTALLDECGTSYYSRELAARYFTYHAQGGATHFVLYDDAQTIREKIETAQREGIVEVFLPYGPLREMLPDVLL